MFAGTGWTSSASWVGRDPEFAAAAAALFESARAALSDRPWVMADGTEAQPSCEVVAAGIDADGTVRLCHLSTTRGERQADQDGMIVVGGAATEFGQATSAEDMPVPDDLASATRLAITLAAACVKKEYSRYGLSKLDDFLAAGTVPSFGPPFHVATITRGGIDFERIDTL
jgi:hypothetical protein